LVENSAKISGHGVDFGVGQKLPVSNALDEANRGSDALSNQAFVTCEEAKC
jgi:hypothetical protein